MLITINKSSLFRELSIIQGVVEKKNTIPILSNLLLEASNGVLKIKGTDLDVSISTSCEAEVKVEGAVCIQAKKIFEITRALPEAAVEIKTAGQDQVSIVCERARFKMFGLPSDNFPEVKDFNCILSSFPASLLQTFISRTVFAITNEESRYALNGAKLELSANGIRMVATDGHRLSFIEKRGSFLEKDKVDVIIPKKTLMELAKLSSETEESIEFGKDDNHLFFRIGDRLLVSRILSGQFPNYELVLPKDNRNQVIVDSERIAGAIKRVALMADERSHAIKFDIEKGQVSITSQASDLGEAGETLPVEYDKDAISAGFNAQYLQDFLGAIPGGDIIFEFKDGSSQAQLRPKQDDEYDFRYVVMPMRL
jgi:DNA polymerase-3 subunit beta